MDVNVIAILGICIMFVLMFVRMPISFAMFIVGFGGLLAVTSPEATYSLLSSEVWQSFSSYTFSVVPLYILMGEIVFRTGITERLFKTAYHWVGHLKGGMAGTTILACAGFASICGSNSATAASMGTMALPELRKYNYNEALSTGSVATGGTLGIIIPPSTVLIVLAIQTEQSIKDLFMASLIPGIILTVFLLLTVVYLCQRNPELGPAGPRFSLREKLVSLTGIIPVLILFGFVIGGLNAGWFTPTESGAFGAFGSLMLSLAMKQLTFERLKLAIASSLKTSAMVIMLIVGATFFGRFMTITRLPYTVAEWVNTLSVPATLILIIILLIYVVGGALMDALGFLIISIPIFYPTIIGLGYNPVWFAVVLCIVTSMGAITPPVGVNVFVVQGLSPTTSIATIFKGASYFLISYTLFIGLLIVFPQIVLLFT